MYGRIACMAYDRSNRNEVGAVTAVCYVLHDKTIVRSHDFGACYLRRNLRDLIRQDGYVVIFEKDDTYVSFQVTQSITLRPIKHGNENLYDYIEKYYVTGIIPENVNENPYCMLLHTYDTFQDKK